MGKPTTSTVVFDEATNVIRVTVVGDVDVKLNHRLVDEVKKISSELRARKKPVLLLADLTHAGKIDTDAKGISEDFFKSSLYDRVAIFGANKENTRALGLLVKTITRVVRVRFFKTQPPALRWLRFGGMSLAGKAKLLAALAIGFALLAIVWNQYIAPSLLRLPLDFSYEASIVSRDNFYNEATSSFGGAITSDTTFAFKTTGVRDGVLDIKNTFDVRTTAGEKIFNAERLYGIDRVTQQHVSGHGDRDRKGYLFAPPRSDKQEFAYWHVNYNEPANMKFENEETILGLTTHQYTAEYRADQTKDLTNLPGVGVTRGVNLDINLQLWIEPETGYLVKYEDRTTAYFYDLATGKRLNPWNQFSNSYSFDSIATHVQLADRAKRRSAAATTSIPVLFGIVSVVLLTRAGILLWRSNRWKWPKSSVARLCAVVIGSVAALVEVGWILQNPFLIRLHPSFSAMHVFTAASFMVVAAILWLVTFNNFTRRLKLLLRLLLGALFAMASVLFLQHVFGISSAVDETLVALGLTPTIDISPITALCFMLSSAALGLSLETGNRIINFAAQALLCIVLALVTFAIAGYGFHLDYIYSIGWFRTMALHSAIAFVFLAIGIFATHPEWHLTRLIRSVSKSLVLGLGVLILLLMLTGSSWQQAINSTSRQTDIQFQGDANRLQATLNNELEGYVKALQGARGLFAASREVDRNEWKKYIDSLRLPQNYPGMLGIGYVQTVSSAQKNAYTNKVRSDGFPAFAIHPAGEREAYAPVTFIEPFNEQNQRAFGFDILSDSVRREAMERARDTGEAAMTSRVKLAQETEASQQHGLLIFIPVYRQNVPTSTIEQRRAALTGYVYTPIRVEDFMRTTVGEQTQGLNIGVFDASSPSAITLENRLYVIDEKYGIENSSYQPQFIRFETPSIADHVLTFRYSSLPNYSAGTVQSLPGLVLSSGILLSAVIAALTFVLSSSRIRAVKLASAMTTDLRNERTAAVTTRRRVEAILTSIGDGVFAIDTSGKIILFNPSAELITGYTAAEMLNQPYAASLTFYNQKDGRPANAFIRSAMSGVRAEMPTGTVLKRKDGVSVPVSDSATPIINADGEIQGAVIVFRDITREKQVEHMKDEFLSVASHELRTPMGAVRANISMILAGDYGPVNKELVEPLTDMKASTVRLVGLVNDLLNVARIEAGRMKFTLSVFNVHEALRGTVASLAPLGKEKGVQITLTPGADASIQADADKIKQVLTNLIGNALKFTEKGSIVVTAERKKDMVEISVADTGIGISAADQKKLFGKFEQITSTQDGKPAGTGLGLYISREIIRKLGGDMWIEKTAVDKGSVFSFTVPLPDTPAAKRAKRMIEREAATHDQKAAV